MPTPIFVLGIQRSGTTWMGNLLAAHPGVSAVVAERHQGIHESLFFSHFARAWDWSRPSGRAAAIEAFLASDYGRLLDLSDRDQKAVRAAETPCAAFRAAMDAQAARAGALAWVEKSPHHTEFAAEIAAGLPDARFVAIHRRTASLIRSRLSAYGRADPRGPARAAAILRAAAANAVAKRIQTALARRYPGRVVQIDFDDFSSGGDTAARQLFIAVGLEPLPGIAPGFAPNSTRAKAPPLRDRLFASVCDGVLALCPTSVLLALRPGRRRRQIVFPAWVWQPVDAAPRGVAVAARRVDGAGQGVH